jgi:hypothetical protein
MDIVLLDPDPNPGMGTRIQDEGNFPKFKNKADFKPFKWLLYLRRFVL